MVAEWLRWTSVSHMEVFLYIAPILAAIGLHITQPEERLSVLHWSGVGLTFGGVAVIFPLLELGGDTALASAMILGDFPGLAANPAWGMTIVVVRTSHLADPQRDLRLYRLNRPAALRGLDAWTCQ